MEDVAEAIATIGECDVNDVKVGKINRSLRNRLGACWCQCPVAAASKLGNSGYMNIGWSRVKVEILGPRPMQCYKCMGAGHTRATCTVEVDRSGLCYRCGQPDHKAGDCTAEPCCPFCSGNRRKADHRYGGVACSYARAQKKDNKKKKEGTKRNESAPAKKVGGNKGTDDLTANNQVSEKGGNSREEAKTSES